MSAPSLPRPEDGCACTPHSVFHNGPMVTEYQLEYEPSCPVHSTHLYDPRVGMWIDRADAERRGAEKALRDTAADLVSHRSLVWAELLTGRADAIARGEQP